MYAMPNPFAGDRHDIALAASNSDDPAVDLVHLSRQTDGDTALEAELLGLFERQSAALLEQLRSTGAREICVDIAHKLRGSALAIGAGRVAAAAQVLETAFGCALSSSREREGALDALGDAVAESRAVIARLLG